jgi:ketosteroid isomerase-like protein
VSAQEVEDLREVARQLSEAILSNDVDRIAAHLSPQWRLVDADGITMRQRFLDVVADGSLTHSRMRATGDLDVRVYGTVGVVLARVRNTAQFKGRTYDADEWTTDIFVRDGRIWVCVHSHVTSATNR